MEQGDIDKLAKSVAREILINAMPQPVLDYKPIDFITYCEKWLRDCSEPHKVSYKDDKARLENYIRKAFGGLQLMEVTHERIKDLHRYIGKERGFKTQANYTIQQLSSIFQEAQLDGYYPKHYILPTKGIKLFPKQKSIIYVKEDQMDKLGRSIDQVESWRMKTMFWLYLLTGCRACEWRLAKWDWIDFSRDTMTIPKTKNGDAFDVLLSPEALALLHKLPRQTDYIFPGNKRGRPLSRSSVWRCWDRTRRRAGLPHIKIHSLRHTFATWLRRSGTAIELLQKLINHKSIQSTMIYLHFENDDGRAEVRKLSKKIGKHMNRKR